MLASFGLIADLHYAEVENGMNFERTHHRFYRRSLTSLENAVNEWRKNKVSFVINLGDTIDGKNVRLKSSKFALEKVLNMFAFSQVPVYHIWGNHELYNFSQEFLNSSALLNPRHLTGTANNDSCSYTHFSPCKNLRVILLDSYDVSVLGRPSNVPSYVEASNILKQNPNCNKNFSDGLTRSDKRFVMYNGGLSNEQLTWLNEVLDESDRNCEDVLIFGHTALKHVECDTLCWNYEEVLSILHRHCSVLAYISGHVHHFYSCIDNKGIHHITMPGTIEIPLEIEAGHSIVDVFEDKIVLRGNEIMEEMTISRTKQIH